MMKKLLAAGAVALALLATPAAAQFADQMTYAGTGAGSANAQTITINNATTYADLLGVVIKYVPGATNNGDATLQVSGNAGALSGSAPHFRKPNGAGVTALTGGELVTGQPTLIMYDGTYFNLMAPVVLPVGIASISNSALLFSVPPNLQINGSVGSNQLTIAVQGNNGVNASATNPIPISFRDTTIANGDPVIVSLQASQSFTINSGNTMGCVSGQMCRLWIWEINNAGTLGLCAYNALSGTTVIDLNDANVQTSASGTNGGNSAQTLYCNISAVSAKAVRRIGYIDIQEATAGTWSAGPTYVQLFGPGIRKPGELIQAIYVSTTSVQTSSGASFPTATGFVQSITPTSAANPIRSTASLQANTGAEGGVQMQIYRAPGGSGSFACTTAVGQKNAIGISASGALTGAATMQGVDLPNVVTQVTYGICDGYITSAGSITTGMMEIDEIMGALDPANDNGLPLSMVG